LAWAFLPEAPQHFQTLVYQRSGGFSCASGNRACRKRTILIWSVSGAVVVAVGDRTRPGWSRCGGRLILIGAGRAGC